MAYGSLVCTPLLHLGGLATHRAAAKSCIPLRRSLTSPVPRYRHKKKSHPIIESFLQPSSNENLQTTSEDTNSQDVRKTASLSAVLTADFPPNQEIDSSEGNIVPSKEAMLPTLQVLSTLQQEQLSATPVHPEALSALYGTFAASCFMERVWRFVAPMVLAMLHKSLLPVAVVGFVDQFIIFAVGPWVGAVMDSMPRVVGFITLGVVQTVSMLISVVVTLYALKYGMGATMTTRSLLVQPWFLTLVIAGAIERLSGLASGVAVERDWVVLLAGPTRQIALAEANARLRRIEMICEIAGPTLFGLLLSSQGAAICIQVAAVAMIVSFPILVKLVQYTDNSSKGVLHRSKYATLRDSSKGSPGLQTAPRTKGPNAVIQGWTHYFAQPVLPASLAYVLLYFNAVLAPGGLMTSFLTQSGLNPATIGIFRGLCGIMGFMATFLSASVICKFGVLKAGAAALIFQTLSLAIAVAIYLTKPLGPNVSLGIFLFLVVISRLGHWCYDLVDAQIFQTAIPESQANQVGTAEMSLASLAELMMLGVAILVSDVTYFGGLATLSMMAVAGAAAIYWHWLANPTPDQVRLFPQETAFEKVKVYPVPL